MTQPMSLQSAQHASLTAVSSSPTGVGGGEIALVAAPPISASASTPRKKTSSKTDSGGRGGGDDDDDDDADEAAGYSYDDRHLRPPPPASERDTHDLRHLYVLPVLLLEFLALSLTRAVLPSMLLETFGDHVYVVMGFAECIRGLLAFLSCPLFGKLSDVLGRKACLFVTVLGTLAPVCSLALMPAAEEDYYSAASEVSDGSEANMEDAAILGEGDELGYELGAAPLAGRSDGDGIFVGAGDDRRIWIFVALLALSGLFSATFTLTFAYISDTVRSRDRRVSAFGLALATFGLSFTIGPMAGGYLARVEGVEALLPGGKSPGAVHPIGQKRVFTTSLVLSVLDLVYIYFFLPESRAEGLLNNQQNAESYDEDDDGSVVTWSDRLNTIRRDVIPETISTWSPLDAFRIFGPDANPLLRRVGIVAFLYYTSLWAVVSTLVLYAAKRFHMGPERLGELMSALGLATMVAEAVLVRMIVPAIGEKRSVRLGLAAFALQCLVLGLAYEPWHLFGCVLFSILGNLVYPSLSSLVSGAVEPDEVGEALGAVNGVKALTEGVGPLAFGTLMTLSERSALPGWPYLIAGMLALVAYRSSAALPDETSDENLMGKSGYLAEKYRRRRPDWGKAGATGDTAREDGEDELVGLLSDVDESYDDQDVDVVQRMVRGNSNVKGGSPDVEDATDRPR